jgi:hypothetical protein
MTTKPLTAAEHAHLLGLQQAVDTATNERDAFVRFLANQHGTNAQAWQLDLGTGAWVPVEKAKPVPVVEEP